MSQSSSDLFFPGAVKNIVILRDSQNGSNGLRTCSLGAAHGPRDFVLGGSAPADPSISRPPACLTSIDAC